jgi:hypothetical protein
MGSDPSHGEELDGPGYTNLTTKSVLERLQRHRRAVIALAHQRAKRLVQASIRAKGQRLLDFSAREITILAPKII